ncbi:MAG: hypothetical protein OXG37_00385 [Actinomycetia bacterium]|nr:hypothetical protein [Actinomycetes bacterium]
MREIQVRVDEDKPIVMLDQNPKRENLNRRSTRRVPQNLGAV